MSWIFRSRTVESPVSVNSPKSDDKTAADDDANEPMLKADSAGTPKTDEEMGPKGSRSPGGNAPAGDKKTEKKKEGGLGLMLFCFVGLQLSYLTWGYVQEKVMTKEYRTGRFPSAAFCVFSNRVLAIVVALVATVYQHGRVTVPAPLTAFAPCSISNSMSSWGQYQALHYVSFPLQTLSKSTKIIPVMLMGKLLNKKTYAWQEYGEAVAISLGVTIFSLADSGSKASATTEAFGVVWLLVYIVFDSFTSQWQSRVYKDHPSVDQFQMMFAVNAWSIILTMAGLIVSGEMWTSLAFISENPEALLDNVTIAITSATGQLFIYYTIRKFGPVVFTIIMTTRQIFSMVLSAVSFGHEMGPMAYVGTTIVFGTIFLRIRRTNRSRG